MNDKFLVHSSAFASISVALILVMAKAVAFYQTGSFSIQASLLDSILDALASALNWYAIKKSLQLPTKEYRFGFGKAEALAGLGQSAIILGSASFFLIDVFTHFMNPGELKITTSSLYIMLFASVLTIGLILWQRYVLKRVKSLAVAADNAHYEMDLFLNLGVFVSLFLTQKLNMPLIDTLFGISAILLIIYKTWPIARQSFDVLMDKELPLDIRNKIKSIVLSNPQVKDVHQLRTHSTGLGEVIQLHAVLDSDLTLVKAHKISHEVEDALIKEFPRAYVIIHQDPYKDEDEDE